MSEIEHEGSWGGTGIHVLAEIERLSKGITELLAIIGTLSVQVGQHETWKDNHENSQSELIKVVAAQGKEITTLKRARDVLYGIVITIALFVSSGLVVYLLQR